MAMAVVAMAVVAMVAFIFGGGGFGSRVVFFAIDVNRRKDGCSCGFNILI